MRHLVTISTIEEVLPIESATAIEKVRVRGWWVVVKKGEFQKGNKCLYYEIDSFLPTLPEYDFLLRGSSPKKMLVDGQEKTGIRLKTIKLRGQISQGLVLPVPTTSLLADKEIGYDCTEDLGIEKYEPPIPPELLGKVKGNFPSFIPKTDEERIQNMAEVLNGFYVTEKIDGTSVTFFKKDGVFRVCSRNLELEDNNGTQWKLARTLSLPDRLPNGLALQGEIVGEGIQKNPYKIKGQRVYFFSAYSIFGGIYLDFQNFINLCRALGVETVPVINEYFALPDTMEQLLHFAENMSAINPNVQREGVVIRSKTEMQYKGQRVSFKVISNVYLLNEI